MLVKIAKYLYWGISWGCTFFVLIHIVGARIGGDAFLAVVAEDFTRQAIGAILCGIFCGSSAIVYTFKNIKSWKQVAIHVAVGLTGYFIIAFRLGWIPMEGGWQLVGMLSGIIIFVVLWFCFYFYNRYEAKKVNSRLKELEAQEDKELK